MLYSIDDIKREVRIALDMNESNAPLLPEGDADTLSIDEIIESKIVDATRIVHRDASVHLIDNSKPFGDSIAWNSAEGVGSGRVRLPDDYFRLVSFRMSDWNYSVSNAITSDSEEYAIQKSRFGVKGNPERPVVAVVVKPTGLYIEFFSCGAGKGTKISEARYVAMPHIVGGEIDISTNLKSAVVYYTAYMTAMTLGEVEQAERMLKTGLELMK